MARKRQRRRGAASAQARRLPWIDVWHAFAIWIIPVQLWAAYKIFEDVSALALRVTIWDLLGAVAYAQAAVLVESALLTALFAGVALLLPYDWYRRYFVAQTFVFALMTASWAAITHTFVDFFVVMPLSTLLLWGVAYVVSLVLPAQVLLRETNRRRRPAWAETFIVGLVARLSPLSALYTFLGVVALLIVFLRNLGLG